MSAESKADHIIRIVGDLPLPAVIEAVATFADGFVEGHSVSSMHFMFDVTAGDGAAAVITARLRHPGSSNPKHKILTPLYNLMAGFYKAGADVSGGFFRYAPGYLDYWPERIDPSPNPLDEALELLKNSIEQDATIIAIGQYTNLALLDKKYPVSRPRFMNAGDASWHYGLTLHKAPGNQSDVVREVMTIIYIADGIRITQPVNDNQEADRLRWFKGLLPG